LKIPESQTPKFEIAARIPAGVATVVEFWGERTAGSGHAERLKKAGLFLGRAAEVVEQLDADGRVRVTAGVAGPEEQHLREASGWVAQRLRKRKVARCAVLVPHVAELGPERTCRAIVTGMGLGWWRHEEVWRQRSPSARVSLVGPGAGAGKIVESAARRVDAQNLARSVAGLPGNIINPLSLADVCKRIAAREKLKFRLLDDRQMSRMRMGGILGVGAGSNRTPPRLIVLEHKPAARAMPPILLVGKGITFDTGGICLKPRERMERMVYDKCGAMTVLGTMVALARRRTPVRVIGLIAAAENHVSATAYRPGDVLTMHNGMTVEVNNTDAEGRLVLADAISWGVREFTPSDVVDVATLTGGCVVALGKIYAGLMGNHAGLCREIERAAQEEGEKLWRLPIGSEVVELIRGDHTDWKNSGGRWASPLIGGAFISRFLPEEPRVRWAHLDIAGVADVERPTALCHGGATGWGVRTLTRWIEARNGNPSLQEFT
jgi:leucyl aminopeptidase